MNDKLFIFINSSLQKKKQIFIFFSNVNAKKVVTELDLKCAKELQAFIKIQYKIPAIIFN